MQIKNWIFISFSILSPYFLYRTWTQEEINCIRYPNKSYTYIIVGAGTAGCVLAARLTEHRHNRVLLIEAGSSFNLISKIPFFAVFLQKSKYDWLYESVPQKWSSLGFHNRIQALPRGKGLGGSGQINLLIYDTFRESSTWILQDTILKFVEAKKCLKTSDYIDYLFLNKFCKAKCKPYFRVRIQKTKSELGTILRRSIEELNISNIRHFDGISSIYNGQRWSTYKSHLLPIANRKNLHIMCNSEVNKIVFKKKRAFSVELIDNKEIRSESEIILSAGSINTPKLLLQSGIGNENELKDLNITPVFNLPGVGRNLHDHIAVPMYVEINKPLTLTFNKVFNLKEILNYLIRKKGVFASSPVAGTIRTSKNFLILFLGSTPEDPFYKVSNFLPETFKQLFPYANSYSQEGFVFLAGCKQTKSRGFVKLSLNKSLIIDPQYLSEEEDVDCIKNAMDLVLNILNTTSFKKIGAKLHFPQLGHCLNPDHLNDQYLKCLIRSSAITNYHQAGTCKMGTDSDSVVDEAFRVKGVSGIRVIDASVLPDPFNNFPNKIVALTAEYASSLFK